MNGEVVFIYTTARSGEPLVGAAGAELEPGRGIVGDRYHSGLGTFWKQLQKSGDFEVTLIETEEIERFNAAESHPIDPGAFRRNIVTRGVRLNELVGCRFTVGGTVLEGIRLCEPCAYLAAKLGPAVRERMAHRAGLRARIVEGGRIGAGDAVTIVRADRMPVA